MNYALFVLTSRGEVRRAHAHAHARSEVRRQARLGEGLGSAGASWAEKKLRYNQSSFTVVRILRTDLGLIDKSSGLPAAVRSEVCATGGTQGGAALGAWLLVSMWAGEMRSSLQQSKKHQKDPFGYICNHSGVIKTNRVISFLTCSKLLRGGGRGRGGGGSSDTISLASQ